MPTRSPVNGPGPTPTATAVTSAEVRPASARTAAMLGATCSVCRRGSRVERSASTRLPSCRATVMAEVEVSRASSSTPLRVLRRVCQLGLGLLAVPARAPGRDGGEPLVVAAQGDLEAVLAQALGEAVAPFDDGHGVLQGGVEVEVVELGEAAEPVRVDVHQRRAAHQRRVHPGDDEGRGRDRAAHPEPLGDALGQRRLARPRSPVSTTRSPARSTAPSRSPHARVSSAVGRATS